MLTSRHSILIRFDRRQKEWNSQMKIARRVPFIQKM